MPIQWWTVVPLLLHLALTLTVAARVMARQLPVAASFAWLFISFWMPLFGAIAYFTVGERRMDPDRRRVVQETQASLQAWQQTLGRATPIPEVMTIARYIEGIAGFPLVSATGITLFTRYEDVFRDLVERIDRASRSCHLSFYIWHEGGLAQEVAASLIKAAGRGVECLVLVDALGSQRFLESPTARDMRDAGVRVVAAMPLRVLRSRWDLRNHRKIVVIDGEVAYAGSQNLVDPRFFEQDAGVGQWVDALVRVEGRVVACLEAVFQRDWSVETRGRFRAPAPSTDDAACTMQVLPSGPETGGPAIQQVLLMALYAARETVTITTPYFVPDDSLLHALVATARRGIGVTLIVPKKNNSVLVTYASASTFQHLLDAGVRIALYRDGLLHTKSVVVDRRLSIFGSVNVDMRSLWLDSEVSLVVHDVAFASSLADLQAAYLTASDLLDERAWRARPRRAVVLERVARLTSPLL